MKHGEKKYSLWLGLILLLALLLMLYGINWDQGTHLHPDERMLVMVTERIEFPNVLDPDFFNYGSFPIYLLAALAQLGDLFFQNRLDTYDGLLYLGRMLSVLVDLGTLVFVVLLAKTIFNSDKIALFAGVLYSLMFFPIQNSHFFVVDNFVSLLLSILFLNLFMNLKHQTHRWALLTGITFGLLIATKITPILFLPFCLICLVIIVEKGRLKLRSVSEIVIRSTLFALTSIGAFMLTMPYAVIRWEKFIADIQSQLQMNSDAYIFPYTLQYVGTTAYWYYVRNIILWGVGPVIFVLFITGLLFGVRSLIVKRNTISLNWLLLAYLCLNIVYFLILGRSAVKFMRYMLPLYPFIAVMAGYGMGMLTNRVVKSRLRVVFAAFMLVMATLWTLMFVNLYSVPHTRIQASNWMLDWIPAGSVLGVEHWDDRLPLKGGERFIYEDLELYNVPDDKNKWVGVQQQLSSIDYIVIASNRLYTPLQRLSDCQQFEKCYPLTAEYYQKLFNGELGFVKVAEFSNYPHLFGIKLIDDAADESFTVYDHPKVMVFKRV